MLEFYGFGVLGSGLGLKVQGLELGAVLFRPLTSVEKTCSLP